MTDWEAVWKIHTPHLRKQARIEELFGYVVWRRRNGTEEIAGPGGRKGNLFKCAFLHGSARCTENYSPQTEQT